MILEANWKNVDELWAQLWQLQLKNKDKPKNYNDYKHEDDLKTKIRRKNENEPRNEEGLKNENGP